jgi:hypothetical protein
MQQSARESNLTITIHIVKSNAENLEHGKRNLEWKRCRQIHDLEFVGNITVNIVLKIKKKYDSRVQTKNTKTKGN